MAWPTRWPTIPSSPPLSTNHSTRHLNCDWGEVDAEDGRTNEDALRHDLRLLSAYNDDRFPKHGVAVIWIITEADRSATTILFPEEY